MEEVKGAFDGCFEKCMFKMAAESEEGLYCIFNASCREAVRLYEDRLLDALKEMPRGEKHE